MFNYLNKQSARFTGLAIASNGNLAPTPFMTAPDALEVISARFVNGGLVEVASATTAGSAVSIVVYKNASATGSRIASIHNNGSAIGSATTSMGLATTTSLKKLAAGDTMWAEVVSSATPSTNNSLTVNWFIQVNYAYGYQD